MSAPELKPCPFCGCTIDVPGSPATREIKKAVHPTNGCLLSGSNWWFVPRFIEPWNTRADPAPDLLEALAGFEYLLGGETDAVKKRFADARTKARAAILKAKGGET